VLVVYIHIHYVVLTSVLKGFTWLPDLMCRVRINLIYRVRPRTGLFWEWDAGMRQVPSAWDLNCHNSPIEVPSLTQKSGRTLNSCYSLEKERRHLMHKVPWKMRNLMQKTKEPYAWSAILKMLLGKAPSRHTVKFLPVLYCLMKGYWKPVFVLGE
jgi:hypothetical protein